ncbi:DUF3693 domain-containing protein [Vibrio ostreicida]|uniref:DUF3693 domain-containing protein n=1 Tax=Vibrio ostreicida TaxID=526588 RepID=UPI003B5C231A
MEQHRKKYNGLGFRGISMTCVCLTMWIGSPSESLVRCVLCTLMLKHVSYQLIVDTPMFRGSNNEVPRNDQELLFS